MEKSGLQLRAIYIAEFLLYTVTLSILLAASLFVFGVAISRLHFVLAMLISCFIVVKRYGQTKLSLAVIVIGLALILLSILISGSIFDYTWDGSSYHKQAIGFLKDGWNPLYMRADDFAQASFSSPAIVSNPIFWAEVYPKATWYYAASVYDLTNNIECSKSINLIFMAIVFCLYFDYSLHCKMKKWQAFLMGLFAGANPISIMQLTSNYLDGVFACAIFALFLLFWGYADEKWNLPRPVWYSLVFCLVLIGCNLKFSVIGFVALSCMVFFGYTLFLKQQRKTKWQNFAFFAICASVGLLIVGAAPYITNFVRFGTPMHGTKNILANDVVSSTFGVPGLANWQMFFLSLFAKMSHGAHASLDELLKIPFSYHTAERAWYFIPDARLGGFGVFFSGVLCFGLLYLGVCAFKNRKNISPKAVFATVLAAANIGAMMLLPVTYNARYIPQLFLIPLAALGLAFTGANKKPTGAKTFGFLVFSKVTLVVLSLFLALNIAPAAPALYYGVKVGSQTSAALSGIKVQMDKGNVSLDVSLYSPAFVGMYYNFRDFGVTNFNIVPLEEVDETFKSTLGSRIFYRLQPLQKALDE